MKKDVIYEKGNLFPEYDNITEDNLSEKWSNLIKLSEADNKLDIYNRISPILENLSDYMKANYQLKFKGFNFLNKELNDIYAKLTDLLENNKDAMNKAASKTLDSFKIVNPIIVKKSDILDTTAYKITFASQYFNPQAIKSYIINITNAINGAVGDISADDIDNILKSTLTKFKNDIDKYSKWLDFYEPAAGEYDYKNIKVSSAVEASKEVIDSLYASYIYQSSKVMAIDLQYIQMMKKMYNVIKDKFEDTKIAHLTQFINDVFGYVLEKMVKGIEFDNRIFEICQKCYKAQYNEIVRIYNTITE